MLIVYASKTGNVERFVQKLPLERSLKICSGLEQITEPCVLLTYTTGLGSVPTEVAHFAAAHAPVIRGVAASGNRNWGSGFAKAAHALNEQDGFPVLHTFELSGLKRDISAFMERLDALAAH